MDESTGAVESGYGKSFKGKATGKGKGDGKSKKGDGKGAVPTDGVPF
jgi:hypothetical protein